MAKREPADCLPYYIGTKTTGPKAGGLVPLSKLSENFK